MVEFQAEEPLHEAVRCAGLHAVTTQSLRQTVVGADQVCSDAVHGVVDIACNGRYQRGHLRQQRLLGRRAHRTQKGFGAAQLRLERGEGVGAGGDRVEVAQQLLDAPGVALEGRRMAQEQVAHRPADVVDPEHSAVDGFMEAYPQAEVVRVQRPLPPELVDVGQSDQHGLAGRPGHRQHIAAERVLRQAAHHGAGGEGQHGGADHPGDAGHHGRHGVVGPVVEVRCHAGRNRLVERAEQLVVVADGAVRPACPVHNLHPQGRPPGRLEAGGIGHPQLGHPHELLDGHAGRRIDVGLRDPAAGDGPAHLASLVGARRCSLQHPHQVADHRNVPQAADAARSAQSRRLAGIVQVAESLQVLQVAEPLEPLEPL